MEYQFKKISLTDFVDVVSSAGSPKATKVKQIKFRDEYHPAFDYYKGLRDYIIEVHKENRPKSDIRDAIKKANNASKDGNYATISNAYYSWWGRKEINWFEPSSGVFERHGVPVSINPELGLIINGKKHLVKLYFKADKLTRNRVEIISFLMSHTLSNLVDSDVSMSVMDIRSKKLITGKTHHLWTMFFRLS